MSVLDPDGSIQRDLKLAADLEILDGIMKRSLEHKKEDEERAKRMMEGSEINLTEYIKVVKQQKEAACAETYPSLETLMKCVRKGISVHKVKKMFRNVNLIIRGTAGNGPAQHSITIYSPLALAIEKLDVKMAKFILSKAKKGARLRFEAFRPQATINNIRLHITGRDYYDLTYRRAQREGETLKEYEKRYFNEGIGKIFLCYAAFTGNAAVFNFLLSHGVRVDSKCLGKYVAGSTSPDECFPGDYSPLYREWTALDCLNCGRRHNMGVSNEDYDSIEQILWKNKIEMNPEFVSVSPSHCCIIV
jgi:hypothetical protein